MSRRNLVLSIVRDWHVVERIAADLDNLRLEPNDPHAGKESTNRTTIILEHVIATSVYLLCRSRTLSPLHSCLTRHGGYIA
jgi:hypothetical protein